MNFMQEVLTREASTQTSSLFVSAGHSDTDPGASGNGYTESDVVLEMRDTIVLCLRDLGIEVSTDGEEGENLPLREAVKMAKRHDLSIELHCNAFSSASANGVETLSKPDKFLLGDELCDAVSTAIGCSVRGAKDGASGQHSRLAFVEDGDGLILELFFLTNKEDLEGYLMNKEELAISIAEVLEDEVCR